MAGIDLLANLNEFLSELRRLRGLALQNPDRARHAMRLYAGRLAGFLREKVSDEEARNVERIADEAESYVFEDIIDTIDEFINHLEALIDALCAGKPLSSPTKESRVSERIFIVHGREGGMKDTVARLLENLGLDPVILHEQPSRGKTLIEKFEDYADVGFAVVILTGDDLGRAKNEKDESPRARQNVVLEHGFFLGKLGRGKVCALLEEGVELPSDLSGIVYIPLEKTDWKRQLVRELQAANYAVDADRIP